VAWKFEDDEDWAEEISEETTRSVYQNALIRIEDPSILGKDYDYKTDKMTVTGDPVLYSGPARLIGVRWGVQSGGESQRNSTTLSDVRVQLPRTVAVAGNPYGSGLYGEGTYGTAPGLLGRVKRGSKIYVEVCERQPSWESMVLSVTSDLQGSMSASRTLEARVDMDAVVTD